MIRTAIIGVAAIAFASGAAAQTAGGPDMERVSTALREAGVETRLDTPAILWRALTDDGRLVFFVTLPGDGNTDEDALRERLNEAGFTNVMTLDEAGVAVGEAPGGGTLLVLDGDAVQDPDTTAAVPQAPAGMEATGGMGASPAIGQRPAAPGEEAQDGTLLPDR